MKQQVKHKDELIAKMTASNIQSLDDKSKLIDQMKSSLADKDKLIDIQNRLSHELITELRDHVIRRPCNKE